MPILLLGDQGCQQLSTVANVLHNIGAQVLLFDPLSLRNSMQLSWWPHESRGLLHTHNNSVPYATVDAVYWHLSTPLEQQNEGDAALHLGDLMLLNTLYLYPQIHWVNPIQALKLIVNRGYLLCEVVRMGGIIPHTYLGNNVNDAILFARHHRQVTIQPAHKPLVMGTPTSTKGLPLRLKCILAQGPVLIQEAIHGTWVKSYVLANTVITTEYGIAPYSRVVTLPESIEQLSRRICRGLGMKWCAITWCNTKQHGYIFVDIEASPDFSHEAEPIRTRLALCLVNLLTQQA